MRKTKVCDSCKKEITEADNGFEISISHENSTVRYDGCSIGCCAKIFHNLADEWDNNSCNQS